MLIKSYESAVLNSVLVSRAMYQLIILKCCYDVLRPVSQKLLPEKTQFGLTFFLFFPGKTLRQNEQSFLS